MLVGTLAAYFGYGGAVPRNPQDWASFGTYVGGIAGPLLSFIALIAVAHNVGLQRAALELDQARQLADQHLRWLDALYKDIVEALDERVSGDIALRRILDGDVEAVKVDQKRLSVRLNNLMQLVAQYCTAVHLYRDNISGFFDLQIYADRGGRVLDAIKPFSGHLTGMILPTIEFCDMHLKGEAGRAKSEAMSRSSR